MSDDKTARVSPLNLTGDEADALWEMAKVAISTEEVQDSEYREDAESVHTKVKELVEDE